MSRPALTGGVDVPLNMDIRKKNLLLAALIGAFAIGLYVYAIYHVMSSAGQP
jgi:hypothetical protein